MNDEGARMYGRVRCVSRRELLRHGAVFGSLGALTPGFVAAYTPSTTLGPFYPISKPLDQDADLTRIAGRESRAQGELLDVVGRILDDQGAPIAGAIVEIWQADAHGRYAHPRDRNPAAIDAEFQGYGQQTTDAEGRYRFRTIKPAAYPTGFGTRTPHVHFQVTGGPERIVTQMFFPGEPLNEEDSVLRGVSRGRERLFARIERGGAGLDSGVTLATFDVVLGG